MVTLALTKVPTDARCIRLSSDVAGRRTTLLANLTPGAASFSTTFGGLPLGSQSLWADIFNIACTSVTSTNVATWVSDPVVVVTTATGMPSITLIVHRPSSVGVAVDFCTTSPCMTCSTGYQLCNGACVDTSSNTSNCGACGNICQGGTNTCLAGTCSCGAHVGACGAGTTCCPNNGNACYNLSTAASSFNCGTCGHSCLGDACASGQCQPTAVSGVNANPFNYPPVKSSIIFAGHTYDMGYAAPPAKPTDQDPAIFKDGNVLCVWDTYSAANEEVSFDGLVADNNFVYGLIHGGPLGVFKCPINGTPRSIAVTVFEDPSAYTSYGLVDNGTAIYWGAIANGSTKVYRLVK